MRQHACRYGTFTPQTHGGRAFTIVLGTFGICCFLILVQKCGETLLLLSMMSLFECDEIWLLLSLVVGICCLSL